MNQPYYVEVDNGGCCLCGGGRTCVIVGPDGVAGGTSYDDESEASAMADALNGAYAKGASAEAALALTPTDKPKFCTRDYGHDGPCNGFPRPVCAQYITARERAHA